MFVCVAIDFERATQLPPNTLVGKRNNNTHFLLFALNKLVSLDRCLGFGIFEDAQFRHCIRRFDWRSSFAPLLLRFVFVGHVSRCHAAWLCVRFADLRMLALTTARDVAFSIDSNEAVRRFVLSFKLFLLIIQ